LSGWKGEEVVVAEALFNWSQFDVQLSHKAAAAAAAAEL